jgi:outer membrane protease
MLALFSLAGATMAQAADQLSNETVYESADKSITVLGGIGYTWLKGNEVVYDARGNRISQLIWKTQAPVATLGAKAVFADVWTASANAVIGFSGRSDMKDYDWLQPYWSGWGDDDWTHRSIHPDTDLDRYINLDLELGRNFAVNDTTSVNLHGGFKYTNVKWTGYGGSFVYSKNGYRDNVGNFPDGERGISFEQRYPTLFIGAEATTQIDHWTLSGLLRGGVAVNASDTDHHWMRDIRFEEEYGAIPFLSVGANANYNWNDRTSFFLAGNFEKYFRRTGDSSLYDISSGSKGPKFNDGAGMDFVSATISVGAKISF